MFNVTPLLPNLGFGVLTSLLDMVQTHVNYFLLVTGGSAFGGENTSKAPF